jgi:4-amino-4-deoxy-L-arabinose transferase-like glycosyltransferase
MPLIRRTGLVFLCTVAYLGWLAASRFVLVMNDEGIYLDGALRVFHGQMPYRDFFSITGPGTFALMATSFRLFGPTLLAARLPVVWDIGIITACLYWLASKLSNSPTAALAAFVYVTFATLVETAVVANHRWDSGAWAILAGTLIVGTAENAAAGSPHAKYSGAVSFAAGIAAGIAAWCTPPVALALIALGACLLTYRAARHLFVAYACGVAVAFAAGATWIVGTGTLRAMLNSLLWNSSNYLGANRTWYGAITDGYASFLHGTSGMDTANAILVLAIVTLPATLPLFSAMWLWKRPSMNVIILLTFGFALVLSTYPRWDLNHLTWVSAPFYALAAGLIASSSSKTMAVLRKALAVMMLVVGCVCAALTIQQRLNEVTRVTSLGKIHGRRADLDVLAMIQARVKPADTLFVFPYRPLLYFVTGARNPTRYSFLQPGMFSDKDESEALSELEAHPPRLVIYAYISPERYMHIWPASDPRRLRMPGIEDFLRDNYRETGQWADLQLLESRSLPFAVR